ncbi:MAG: HEAT repeat domain-containing protein [Proteobacteria bacterium]|nr:HEAT repeat domain-containing protein [Pseudomonadota bacterium]
MRLAHLLLSTVVATVAMGLSAGPALATTWDEPWTEKVIAEADSFIEIEISQASPTVAAKVVDVLAGERVPPTIQLAGFYLLDLGSRSGHGPEYRYDPGTRLLCLVKESKKPGTYGLATPTSGAARIRDDGLVIGALRHSYHQGLFVREDYVRAVAAIFKNLHGEPAKSDFVAEWVDTYLGQPPAALENDATSPASRLFFAQHLVLESLYYFGRPEHFGRVVPFLGHKLFHHRISAARALSAIGGKKAVAALLDRLANDDSDFVKVMAVWALQRLDAKEAIPRLIELETTASEEPGGFGGNLMDPRIGTRFPTVKQAIKEALTVLQQGAQSAPQAATGQTGSPPASDTAPRHPGQVRPRSGCGCDSAAPGTIPGGLLVILPWLLLLFRGRRAATSTLYEGHAKVCPGSRPLVTSENATLATHTVAPRTQTPRDPATDPSQYIGPGYCWRKIFQPRGLPSSK